MFSLFDKIFFSTNITPLCSREGTNATDKRCRDVWNVEMDSSSDRTEDRCSSQKSDSMDRSWMEKKTCPHFLLSSTISSLSLFLSPSDTLFFFLFYPWSVLSLHANIKRAKHFSYHVWYVRANLPIERVMQGHSKATNDFREYQTHSIADRLFHPV